MTWLKDSNTHVNKRNDDQGGLVEPIVRHIFRMQDKDGRGPFKPGFTIKWNEGREDMASLPPFYCEFPSFNAGTDVMADEYCGCACASLKKLRRWFTKTEYTRLKKLGYRAVKLKADRIIHESDIQIIFARKRPLMLGATEIKLYA